MRGTPYWLARSRIEKDHADDKDKDFIGIRESEHVSTSIKSQAVAAGSPNKSSVSFRIRSDRSSLLTLRTDNRQLTVPSPASLIGIAIRMRPVPVPSAFDDPADMRELWGPP